MAILIVFFTLVVIGLVYGLYQIWATGRCSGCGRRDRLTMKEVTKNGGICGPCFTFDQFGWGG